MKTEPADLSGPGLNSLWSEPRTASAFPVPQPDRSELSLLYALARDLTYRLPDERFAFRGSFAIHTWLSDTARLPKDIDVVGSRQLLEIDSRLESQPRYRVDGGYFDWGWNTISPIGPHYPSKDIGHRMSCRYIADERVIDTVQLDWAVDDLEVNAIQPVTIGGEVDGDGDAFTIPTVVPELELLWKLLWITGEMDRQVKDLFDAALILDQIEIDAQRFARFFRNRANAIDPARTFPQRLWQLADREEIPLTEHWPIDFPRRNERTKTPLDAWHLLVERLPGILDGLAFFPSAEELPLWAAARSAEIPPNRAARSAYADWLEEQGRIEGEFLRHHDRISFNDNAWGANELRRWFELYPKLPPGFAESMNVPHPLDFKRRIELHLDLKRWANKPTAEIRQVLLAN